MDLQRVPTILSFIAIYAVYGSTFLLAGGMKVVEGKVPEWFVNQFSKTPIAKFPGLTICYWSIAVLECVVPVLLMISLFRMEFSSGIEPLFLGIAVGVASVVFAILGFGLRLVNDFGGAANSFFYFAATLVTQLYLKLFH